jgi:hypothetical protein
MGVSGLHFLLMDDGIPNAVAELTQRAPEWLDAIE